MLCAVLCPLLALALCGAGHAPAFEEAEAEIRESSAVCLMQQKRVLGESRAVVSEKAVKTHGAGDDAAAAPRKSDATAPAEQAGSAEAASAVQAHGVRAGAAVGSTVKDAAAAEKVAAASAEANENLALRMKLRLKPSLSKLHKESLGPIPRFLQNLRSEFCKSIGLPHSRLSILGIRGEYFVLSAAELEDPTAVEAALLSTSQRLAASSHQPDPALAHMDHDKTGKNGAAGAEGAESHMDSTVDLEVLPAQSVSESSPAQVLSFWQTQLKQEQSSLRTGPLQSVLQDAVLVAAGPPIAPVATLGGNGHSAAAPLGRPWLSALVLGAGLLQLLRPAP